jgi:hypothetical protein
MLSLCTDFEDETTRRAALLLIPPSIPPFPDLNTATAHPATATATDNAAVNVATTATTNDFIAAVTDAATDEQCMCNDANKGVENVSDEVHCYGD